MSINEVFAKSDIVTIQTAKNPQTIDMIKKEQLDLLKDGSPFVNTSRGPTIARRDKITNALITNMLAPMNNEPTWLEIPCELAKSMTQ